MSQTSSLVIPIVLWGKDAPSHPISSLAISPDLNSIVTGCNDGQIIIWDIQHQESKLPTGGGDQGDSGEVSPQALLETSPWEMTPRCFLIGHSGPILSLAFVHLTTDNFDLIISSSDNGELCNWDAIDGRCLESSKCLNPHTKMQPYTLAFSPLEPKLFCTGYYPDIHLIDPVTLETLLCLSSHVNPDWVSALHVLRPNKKLDDVILATTISGTVKVWTINEQEFREKTPLYENESKTIRTKNVSTLVCCLFNNRTVLIVADKVWQIYDAGDFSVLTQCAPKNKSETWIGGDFISPDKVVIFGSTGKAYLFKLPNNCIVEHKDFHRIGFKDEPFNYCLFNVPNSKNLVAPPCFNVLPIGMEPPSIRKPSRFILIRGDHESKVVVWNIPDVTNSQISQLKQMAYGEHSAEAEEAKKTLNPDYNPPEVPPKSISSLQQAWDNLKPSPPGILDQFDTDECHGPLLTCSIFIPQQSRLVCGREDGSIVVVPATHAIMLHLLHGRHQQYEEWPLHQILLGHKGKVNCLVYPHGVHPRYDPAYLVSGGRDFSVILWDIVKCDLLYRFCCHAGEITQILVPPNDCSTRVLQTVCSVSTDHSAALLSLREKKCVLLASRHLFPITSIKWRPLDDFLIIGCADGTVHVWQMETGHLDRVLYGMAAEDVLLACDENGNLTAMQDTGLANPAVHFFRGLKSRNLAAIRHAAQRGLNQLHQQGQHGPANDPLDHSRTRLPPLVVQGLRTNDTDPEAHVLFFDVEALIVQLLSDEYGSLSPCTLEAQGLIGQTEYCKIVTLTHSSSPDAQKKIADSAASLAGLGSEGAGTGSRRNRNLLFESSIPMEIAQLLISLLLGWGLDQELDSICEARLGLLKPLVPICFGQISRGGYMSLMSPTWKPSTRSKLEEALKFQSSLSQRVKWFTSRTHWEVSCSLTTNHLLAIVALANTLMSMQNATFVAEQERIRKANRPSTKGTGNLQPQSDDGYISQQAASKHGWSLVATLHCVMLHEKLKHSICYKEPLVETLALRWQDRCVEVRDAAQALLLAELSRIGVEGRKRLVDLWGPYLPNLNVDPFSTNVNATAVGQQVTPVTTPSSQGELTADDQASVVGGTTANSEQDFDEDVDEPSLKPSPSEHKRKQTTAIILLGVLGAEFGQEITARSMDSGRNKGVEGFGVGNSNLARLTSKALSHLLLNPQQNHTIGGKVVVAPTGPFSPLRRAAIDLIGRGFTVWEPFLDVSKVLLALLELCCEADNLVPSMSFGLPLTPQADACRTARHALTLIATARPAAFITTMAKEVARYNTLQQNAQAIQINLNNIILNRSKPEILRVIELLIEKMQSEISDLIVEVMDIVLHCVDHGHLKTRGLGDVFPVLCRFSQVTHCPTTRRIAVGSKQGNLAIYELRSSKCQTIPAHASPPSSITACAFSPDGKFLASYSCTENKMSFWQQSSSGMFGLGHTQTRCVKTISTVPLPDNLKNTIRSPRLVWTGSRNVSLMLADGSENRYGV
ncbi:unnamed protein product [Orchesella dallaii]|uniref:WD repeat-containing protein 7 n=1 Tax=Orchesella dallaii TaxID=48710 RepID=A0ABP1Q2D3_9HEXA